MSLPKVLFAVICLLTMPANAETRPGALADLRIAKGQKDIAEAWLADPTTRYRHYVLGSPYEAASIAVRLKDGRTLKLTLPDDSVFEDRQPRLADLDGDGRDEIVLVRSYLGRGAALAVLSVVDGQLKIIAETPPTGWQNTWLNPAGIADFDGDGRLDIAYVQMPHVMGKLRLWTLKGGKLVELASLPDTSNHANGSPEIGLSAVADFDGDGTMDLAVPSLDRRSLRFITFKGGARELKRKPLPSAAVASFRLEQENGKPVVVVGLEGGKTVRVGY
jgi:FG-GAP-like repeat